MGCIGFEILRAEILLYDHRFIAHPVAVRENTSTVKPYLDNNLLINMSKIDRTSFLSNYDHSLTQRPLVSQWTISINLESRDLTH